MGRYTPIIQNEDLRHRYERAERDGKLKDMDDDLALLRAMCEIIVERCFPKGSGPENMSLERIGAVTALLGQINKLIDSITNREKKLEVLVDVDKIKGLMDRVVTIITRHVPDQDVVRRIAADLGAATSMPVNALALTAQEEEQ